MYVGCLTAPWHLQDIPRPLCFHEPVLDLHCAQHGGGDLLEGNVESISLCVDLIAAMTRNVLPNDLQNTRLLPVPMSGCRYEDRVFFEPMLEAKQQ